MQSEKAEQNEDPDTESQPETLNQSENPQKKRKPKGQYLFSKILRKINDKKAYESLIKFLRMDRPSFDNLKIQVEQAIQETPENTINFYDQLITIMKNLIEEKVPGSFQKIIINFLEKNTQEVDSRIDSYSQQKVESLWTQIHFSCIESFLQIFKIFKDENEKNIQFQKYVQYLTKDGKFEQALKFIDLMKMGQEMAIIVVKQIKNDESKQAGLINQYNLPRDQFLDVLYKINKNCVRYHYKEYPWYKCEEMLEEYQTDLLPILVEMLYYDHYENEAISIVQRTNILSHIQNPQLRKQIQNRIEKQEITPKKNKLFDEDAFIPTDLIVSPEQLNQNNFIKHEDLGVDEQRTLFINDDQSELFKQAQQILLKEGISGIDTEFITPKTKFDNKKEHIEILQISSDQFNFVFDAIALKKSTLFKEFLIEYFSNPLIIKVGHTLKEDIKLVCSHMIIRNITIPSVIDIQVIFKTLNPDKKQSSLAFITENIFVKKLSKVDQCSNWSRRPLRKAQLHYAALDALICLRIYQKISQQNSEICEKKIEQIKV